MAEGNPYPPEKTTPTGRDYHDVYEEGRAAGKAERRSVGKDPIPRFTLAGLNDYGGGDVQWWHDYIREIVEAANDHVDWAVSQAYHSRDEEVAEFVDACTAMVTIPWRWHKAGRQQTVEVLSLMSVLIVKAKGGD